MALKQWISRFAAGLGIDTTDSTGMEELVQNVDGSHVAQIHAVRDSLIALERDSLGAPWFNWNGVDDSQFDTKIEGNKVASSTVAVATYGGVKWLTIEVTSDGTASPNGHANGVILPITEPPPTADYLIVADMLILTYTSTITVGVVARYDTVAFEGYGQRFSGASSQQMVDLTSSGSARAAPSLIGFAMADPDMAANRGSRLNLEVRGDGTAPSGSDVILKMRGGGGEHQIQRETSGLHTAAKQAGLWVAAAAASSTTKAGFRRIRCYSLTD